MSSCNACGNEQVEIGLTIDGSRLIMRSCSNCDTRSWHRDGEHVGLDGVLHDIERGPDALPPLAVGLTERACGAGCGRSPR